MTDAETRSGAAALVITEPSLALGPEALVGKARETLRVTWEECRWTRKRVVTSSGRTVVLALPTGSFLEAGAVIAVGNDWYLAVEARPEPVLAAAARDRAEAIRVAFEVGNRHFPLAVDGDALLVPDDPAMQQLLTRLGVAWERREAVFDPMGGGRRQAPGTSPLDGHAHSHRHDG